MPNRDTPGTPAPGGLVFDLTGSYYMALLSFVFALLAGAVFIFLARRPGPPLP